MTDTQTPTPVQAQPPEKRTFRRRRPAGGDGMVRDGMALSTSAGMSAVVGMVTWIIAAQLMPQAEVGRASGFVSGFLLIAGVAQLNLGVALLRWMPRAGRRIPALLRRTTAVVVVTGIVAASVYLFLPGSGVIFAAITGSRAPSLFGWGIFVMASVAWVVMQVQDFTLVGLGRAWWAPGKNLVVMVARLSILLALGSALTAAGIVWSWVLPVTACAVLFTVVTTVFGRRRAASAPVGELPGKREVRSFVGPSYIGTIGAAVLYNEVPLLVIYRFGPTVGGGFFIVWQAVTVIDVVATYFVFSVVSSIAREPDRARGLALRARKLLLSVFLPALALGAAIAGPLLSLFGPSYAAEAPILRLLILGVAFRMVVVHALAVRQAVGDAMGFARLQWVTTVLMLGAVVVVPSGGASGHGALLPLALAYLALQVVSAAVVLLVGHGRTPGSARPGLARAIVTLGGSRRPGRRAEPPGRAPSEAAAGPVRVRRAAREGRSRIPAWCPALLAVAAIVLLPVAALTIDLDRIPGLGLAGVLPAWAWLSIACAVAACATEICRRRPGPRRLAVWTGVLILCTTGMPSVVEPAARMPVAWLHTGFVDAIARTGQLPLQVDSRFSWAGFFAQWAWIQDAGGGHNLDTLLRWAPPVIVAIWALGVFAIARPILGGTRGPWVAVWLFLGANWIEQDYFSPQATAIVLVLAMLACALGPLATSRRSAACVGAGAPNGSGSRRRRVIASLRDPVRRPRLPPGQILLLWGVFALSVLAVVVDHQSTPFAVGAQLVVLALAGRFWGRRLVVLLFLAELTWFVLGASVFWTGHLELVVGNADTPGGSIASGVLGRLDGDPGQLAVKLARVLMALATWVLAAYGGWLRWRRGHGFALFLVAFVPVGLAGVSSYGGEVFMRVLLYGLPLLAVLGAEALRHVAGRVPRIGRPVLAATMALMFAVLVTIRGGNDSYLMVRPQQVALERQVMASVPAGSTVLGLTQKGPTQLARVGVVEQTPTAPDCETLTEGLIHCLDVERPDVVMVYPQMDAAGTVLEGKPRGWTRHAIAVILSTGDYHVTYRNGLSAVLRRVP